MEHKFGETQHNRTRNKPNSAGMNQRVSCQDMNPKQFGRRVTKKLSVIPAPLFANRDKFPLKGKICDRVTNEKCEQNRSPAPESNLSSLRVYNNTN